MRALLPVLLLLAAGVGLWFLLGDDGTAPPTTDLDADGEPTPGPARPEPAGGMRTVASVKVIGIAGEPGLKAPPMDPSVVEDTMLRFRDPEGGLTGAALLEAIEKQAEGRVPLLFPDRRALESFRALRIRDELDREHAPLPEVLQWLRPHGYEASPVDGRLLIRRR